MINTIKLEIAPLWKVIEEARQKVEQIFEVQGFEADLKDASIMVVSELLENAIKYGVSNENNPRVSFELNVDNEIIQIFVKNGIQSNPNLTRLTDMMNKVKVSNNKTALYTSRLMEILNDPTKPGSYLGLYRIVSEGGFDLDYKLSDESLEIVASRTRKRK